MPAHIPKYQKARLSDHRFPRRHTHRVPWCNGPRPGARLPLPRVAFIDQGIRLQWRAFPGAYCGSYCVPIAAPIVGPHCGTPCGVTQKDALTGDAVDEAVSVTTGPWPGIGLTDRASLSLKSADLQY